MKFGLKHRPFRRTPNFHDGIKWYMAEKVDEWFEDFEKGIHDKIEMLNRFLKDKDNLTTIDASVYAHEIVLLKEILGEP